MSNKENATHGGGTYRVSCEDCGVKAVVQAKSFASGAVETHQEEKNCASMEWVEI